MILFCRYIASSRLYGGTPVAGFGAAVAGAAAAGAKWVHRHGGLIAVASQRACGKQDKQEQGTP